MGASENSALSSVLPALVGTFFGVGEAAVAVVSMVAGKGAVQVRSQYLHRQW